MESCCDSVNNFSPLPANYPGFVAQNLEEAKENDTHVQIFYKLNNSFSHYRFRIPELLGKRIRGCFHGWVLLSSHPNNVKWFLWNPVTLKFIYLPPLILKDGDSNDIRYCCLLSPPDDPNSLLLLTRTKKPNIVFCRLDCKRKKLRWTEMTYAKHVTSITGGVSGLLCFLTCCNGKVYAFISRSHHLVQLVIVVNEREVLISLLPILLLPTCPFFNDSFTMVALLKGSCTELFTIIIGFKDKTCKTVGVVYLFKLDMTSMMWEEIQDLKDTIFSVELVSDLSVLYTPAVATELGGYIHILDVEGKLMYSYHVKDRTISLSSMPCLSHVSTWAILECRLEGDHVTSKQEEEEEEDNDNENVVRSVEGDHATSKKEDDDDNDNEIVVRSVEGDHSTSKQEEEEEEEEDDNDHIVVRSVKGDEIEFNSMMDESRLPQFRVLEIISEFFVGVKYLKFLPVSCFGKDSRLEGDHADSKREEEEEDTDDEIVVRSVKDDEVGTESRLLNIPFELLAMIMEFSVGVEYLKFRATCKYCHLAAPLIQWTSNRLQTYSIVSPWLMVFDNRKGIITFTDPMFGNKYFLKTPQELICDFQIFCSKYGWLLLFKVEATGFCKLMFFNPFTSDIREIPYVASLESFCFSAPPTSPDCMVVGFTKVYEWHVYIHFVAREQTWRKIRLGFGFNDPYSFCFPVFYGRDLYALCNEIEVDVFRKICEEDYSWDSVIDEAPTSCCKSLGQNYLVKCDQHLLLVIIGECGESVEVFKSNDYERNWVKINDLGRNMIYISDTSCVCIEAKTPMMENKIYFPRLHSGMIVFYSLETCVYHTFSDNNIQENFEDFFGTRHYLTPHAWIEPSWS